MSAASSSSSSSLLLHLHFPPPPPLLFHKLQPCSQLNSISFHLHKPKHFSISASSSPSSSSSFEREESRWLREEQRWIREEQRWIREETRWNSERESLLQEIDNLKSQLQALKRQGNSNNVVRVLNHNQISETGSGPVRILLESVKEEEEEVVVKEILAEEVKEMVVKEIKAEKEEVKKVKKKSAAAVRKGSEGEEVRAMQEALHKLGFYSGEEDMEFSSFSSGTERAIKTWQASLGIPEDGIMTAELLEKLYVEQGAADWNSIPILKKERVNGASVASVTEISETKQIVAEESGDADYGPSYHQVFLLGENRWENSSRLVGGKKQIGGSTVGVSTTKCLACRGEGRVLCSECDGTGEPNIEEQFLEWVDEGAKCPYCEGLGYNICDVCDGKEIIRA